MDEQNLEIINKYFGGKMGVGGTEGRGGGQLRFPSGTDSRFQMQMLNMNKIPRVTLDPSGCLSLSNILHSFTAGVNEEQAWALCYQTIKAGQIVLNNPETRDRSLLVTEPHHVRLHQDGSVHKSTFFGVDSSRASGEGPPREHSTDECKIVSNLTEVIYDALNFGMEEDAERVLSPELELFLDKMVSADESGDRPETDDEGIERDSGDSDDDRMSSRAFNFLALLKICRERLGSSPTASMSSSGGLRGNGEDTSGSAVADNHYKAVIRALVAETLELSTFLEKVAHGKIDLRVAGSTRTTKTVNDGGSGEEAGLHTLHFTDWARLWVQVIRDLRNGVKLKKVESFDLIGPIEYELTPYEILMDDIRSRRYKLKQVMVDGELPQKVKRDAHELILDFIRGRPPLRKAADRVLPPPPKKALPPIEALMESIRTQDPHSLRPTKTVVKSSLRKDFRNRPPRRQSSYDMTTDKSSTSGRSTSTPATVKTSDTPDVTIPSSNTQSASTTCNGSVAQSQTKATSTPQRRLIKVDLEALYGNDKDDDSEEDDKQQFTVTKDNDGNCYYGQICPPDHTQSEPVTPWKERKDMVGDAPMDSRRRHTICNPTMSEEHAKMMITFPLEYTNNTLNVFSSLTGPTVSPILARRHQNLPRSMSKSQLQEEFFQSNQWQTAMECLSLNLEEVVHIRNVLTKAELEALPVDCSTKEDVEKGKVCFLCLKSRFSLFGPWGNSCKLCKRMVCGKCCSKMRIPTEHFANIPVSTLSPLLSPMREEDSPTHTPGKSPSPVCGSANGTLVKGRKNSVGSAPTSPSLSRKSDDSGQRSISPLGSGVESEDIRDRISPDGHSGPYSLPTVSSISLSLQALKRRGFGRKKEDGKTEKLMGQLMVVCHDCKAMVLQIIRSSRIKKGQNLRTNMTLDLPQIHPLA